MENGMSQKSNDERVNFIKLICSRLDEKFQSNDVETKHIKPVEKNWDKQDKIIHSLEF